MCHRRFIEVHKNILSETFLECDKSGLWEMRCVNLHRHACAGTCRRHARTSNRTFNRQATICAHRRASAGAVAAGGGGQATIGRWRKLQPGH